MKFRTLSPVLAWLAIASQVLAQVPIRVDLLPQKTAATSAADQIFFPLVEMDGTPATFRMSATELSTLIGGGGGGGPHVHAATDITSGVFAAARYGSNTIPHASLANTTSTGMLIGSPAGSSVPGSVTIGSGLSLSASTLSLGSHVHSAADITSGTLDSARFANNTIAPARITNTTGNATLIGSPELSSVVGQVTLGTGLAMSGTVLSVGAHNHAAADINSGTFAAARYGAGTIPKASLVNTASNGQLVGSPSTGPAVQDISLDSSLIMSTATLGLNASSFVKGLLDNADGQNFRSDIGVGTTGTVAFEVLDVSNAILLPNGTAGDPSIRFKTDNDGTGTGIYRVGSNHLGISTNGTNRIDVSATGVIEFHDIYRFPTNAPAANQILKSDASGTLTWQADASGGGADEGAIRTLTGTSVGATVLNAFSGATIPDTDTDITEALQALETAVETKSAVGHTHAAGDINSGTFVSGRFAANTVSHNVLANTSANGRLIGSPSGAATVGEISVSTGLTLSGTALSLAAHNHAATDVNSGTFDSARYGAGTIAHSALANTTSTGMLLGSAAGSSTPTSITIGSGLSLATSTLSFGTIGDGTVSAPAIAFTADTNTGIYRVGADAVALTTGGVKRLEATTTGITIGSADPFTLPLTDGTANQILKTDGNGVVSWAADDGGAGGSPGGNPTEVQFNNSGAFGGNSAFTFASSTLSVPKLALPTGTITTSQPAINVTQTWNAGGVAFAGIFANVTDTASAVASKLVDLQVGGVSRFGVQKDGDLLLADNDYGDISVSSGVWGIDANAVVTADINNSAVTYAKIQNVAQDTLLGGPTGAAGVAVEYAITDWVRDTFFDATDADSALAALGLTEEANSGTFGLTVLEAELFSDFDALLTGTFTRLRATAYRAGPPITDSSTSRVLSDADDGRTIVFTSNSNITVTVPAGLSGADVFNVSLIAVGDGDITFAPGSGTPPLHAIGGVLATTEKYQSASVYEYATSTYHIAGTGGGGSGTTSPGGSPGEVQFNNAGAFGGDADLTFDGTHLTLGAGSIMKYSGRSAVSSPADANVLLTNAAASSFGLLQFGGTTSSFPAIKRNTTGLQVRLADDSAFAPITASSVSVGTAYTLPTGTGTANQVPVNNGSGTVTWTSLPIEIGAAVSDETTDITTGTAKLTMRIPRAMTITAVRASVNTAPTGSAITVDVNKNGSTIFSTPITIDATEETSTTAAPSVLSTTTFADDDEVTIDIDAVGSTTPGKGLKIWILGTRL